MSRVRNRPTHPGLLPPHQDQLFPSDPHKAHLCLLACKVTQGSWGSPWWWEGTSSAEGRSWVQPHSSSAAPSPGFLVLVTEQWAGERFYLLPGVGKDYLTEQRASGTAARPDLVFY